MRTWPLEVCFVLIDAGNFTNFKEKERDGRTHVVHTMYGLLRPTGLNVIA